VVVEPERPPEPARRFDLVGPFERLDELGCGDGLTLKTRPESARRGVFGTFGAARFFTP
jgi:hypothetical protein